MAKRNLWSSADLESLKSLVAEGVLYRRIARTLGRTENAIRVKVYELGISDTHRTADRNRQRSDGQPKCYDIGRQARVDGERCDAPGIFSPVDRAWWLAGWMDKDIELGHSVIGEVAA